MKYCNCPDWKIGIKQIDSAIQFQYIHGIEYKGPIFNFCPWCGVILEGESKLDQSKIGEKNGLSK